MRLDAYGAAGGNDKDECYVSAPPSENIWDKFELDSHPITPPRSPELNLMFGVDDCDLDVYLNSLSRRTIDGDYDNGLRSKVIHDCMWSGGGSSSSSSTSSGGARPSLTASGYGDGAFRPCAGERQRKESFDLTVASVAAVTGASTTTAVAPANTAMVDCVDPTAVFPYPLNREHSYSMMTPAPSDSEDEIDVVGGTHLVDSQRVRASTGVCRLPQPTAGSFTSASNGGHQQQPPPPVRQLSQSLKVVAAARSEYGSTLVVDVNHNRLSAAANERLLSNSVSQKRTAQRVSGPIAGLQQQQQQRFHHHHPYLSNKRPRRHLSTPPSSAPSIAPVLLLQQQQHSPASSGCSRNSSDSEDYDGKRSMHNVLERKRRNDLKSSFFLLRDHVPELRQHERAAKVVILAKATEYTRRLRQEEACLLAELSAEKQKQARLLDQLERLRTSYATAYYA